MNLKIQKKIYHRRFNKAKVCLKDNKMVALEEDRLKYREIFNVRNKRDSHYRHCRHQNVIKNKSSSNMTIWIKFLKFLKKRLTKTHKKVLVRN